MKLISEVVLVLRGAEPEIGGSGEISVPPYLASLATRRSANLDGLGIDTEIILKTVYALSYLLADFLHQTTKGLPSVVVLTA